MIIVARSEIMRLRRKAWAKPLLEVYTDRVVITKLDFLTIIQQVVQNIFF